ncbi:probable methyltransferase BMT2 homolog isoform X2 [Limulus polyphemus]|uniref:S-adenosylmethionine sensor upstream of mTORC1 n=1 Tax=Limulus polyphemus TaxID=6850 RepID=A0ABM1SPP2_LIMPO|nr:probable methyltransferase BMT2 homolog isoform X2 [Limulus polyphemus]
MACSENDDISQFAIKREHHRLVQIIRNVHEHLRYAYKQGHDADDVWKAHCSNLSERQEYAQAMQKLATTMWARNNTRIEWCLEACRSYFSGGGLEYWIKKDAKDKKTPSFSTSCDTFNFTVVPPLKENILLLDVGSCYNPFRCFKEIVPIAIDLTPATPDVYTCDFLKVSVVTQEDSRWWQNQLISTEEVKELPGNTFHVVILSLVLEYLPAPHQRWTFCTKAYQLLQYNGLLLIITPDSKHQNKNALMIKNWKRALATLGFQRILYEKQTHLHCMGFRKVEGPVILKGLPPVDDPAQLLYIPQDLHNYNILNAGEKNIAVERKEDEDNEISASFLELPFEA